MKNKITSLFILTFIGIGITLQSQVPSYIPISGLQAWYPFNGNANDDSGSGHNGTPSGAALTADRFGAASSAYMFGANKYISISDDANFRPQIFSISSWVTFTSTPTSYHLILAKNIGSGSPESIDINYAASYNSWFCNISNASSLGPFITSTQNIVVGTWYNIIYQFDEINNMQKIFVNGVAANSSVVTTSIAYDTKPWTIGMEYENNTPSFFFNGKIDDIGIWNRILTQQEITAVYQSNPTGIKENTIETNFCSVSPNPVNQNLIVNIDNYFIQKLDNEISLNIYSSVGKLVKSHKLNKNELQNSNTLNIENLANGFYYLNISSGNYSQNIKFIKE